MTSDNNIEDTPPSGENGGYEEFVRLLLEYEPRVRSYLRGILPKWQDVDDVMQDASVVAWRKFAQFEPQTDFGRWMLTIARFEALKFRRRLARSPLVFSEDVWELLAKEAADEEASPREVRSNVLEHCLEKLSAAQRELVLKAHAPGVRINEIARQAGRSEQAFYKTLQRLRAAVLECVSRTMAEGGLP